MNDEQLGTLIGFALIVASAGLMVAVIVGFFRMLQP